VGDSFDVFDVVLLQMVRFGHVKRYHD
jgi:hypothetical protein